MSADVTAVVGILKALDETLQKSLKAANITDSSPPDSLNDKPGPQTEKKKEVFIRVVFIKLGEINTVQECFHADAFVQARWRETKLDGKGNKGEEKELVDWNKYWNPRIFVENCLGDPKESVWYQVHYDHSGSAFVVQKRRIKGTFFEKMELDSYPFDTQDITLTVTTHRGENEIDLIADPSEISTVNTQSFVDEQEWSLHKLITSTNKVTTNAYKSSKHKHPGVSVSCKASRRFNFFLWNIILIMVFIGILLFTTFAVDVTLVQNRLQLSFILLLSNITFKFNIAQTLPKVSYLTLLDKYVILQMAMMCLVCLWHASVFLVYDLNDQDEALVMKCDRIGFGVLLAIYVIFQLTFMIYAAYLVKRKGKIFLEKERKQKQMLSLMDLDTGKKGKRRQILPITTPEDATEENSTATDAVNHKDSQKQSPSKESKA